MRKITLIIVHCSAVRPDQTSLAAQIDTWHRQRGFHLGIGYHYVVRRDGEIELGCPEWIVGHHDLNPLKDCPCITDVATEYKDLQPSIS